MITELGLEGYDALYRWSIEHRDQFWAKTIERLGVVFQRESAATLDCDIRNQVGRYSLG